MKIRALKTINSSLVIMEEGDVKEVELDEPTYQYWTSNGLIEEVKDDSESPPEDVTTDANQ